MSCPCPPSTLRHGALGGDADAGGRDHQGAGLVAILADGLAEDQPAGALAVLFPGLAGTDLDAEHIAGVQRAVSYTPERPVLERELFQFVERLFAINADYPRLVQDGHLAAYAYTRGRASTEFRNFLEQEKTYLRQKTNRGLIRTVERKTISFREDGGLVLIRFRSSERTQEKPAPLTRDLLLTLQFVREQSRDRAEIDINPLGIYITHFETSEER